MKEHAVLKEFGKYVSLNVLAMVGLSGYILADTFFVAAGLGTNGLTALNLAIPIYSFINGTGLMIGIGGATKYAIRRAKSDGAGANSAKANLAKANLAFANSAFSHSVALGLFLGLCFALVGIFLTNPLCTLLGCDDNTFAMTSTYLRTLLLFAPMFICNNILIAFVRNDGSPDLSMAAMLTGSVSNIVLDYVFIFPCGMGMFGAAFATGLAPVISMLVLSTYFLKKKNHFQLVRIKVVFSEISGICLTGLSSFITEVASGLVIILFNIVILKLAGNVGVAAYGVVANLALVATAIYTGIAQGIQPLLSKYHGGGLKTNINTVLRYALRTGLAFFIIIYGLTFFLAPQIVAIFNSEQNSILSSLGIQGLQIYFIGFLFSGISILLATLFSSTERPIYAFVISLLRGCILMVPTLLICSSIAGLTGVWSTYPICELLTFLIAVFLYKKSLTLPDSPMIRHHLSD